jgi:uncharacterized UBP type Zn finger protein
MLDNRNYCQTNREQTKESSATAINNNTTTMMIIDRKLSLATQGLQPYVENWLRIRTSNENGIRIKETCSHFTIAGENIIPATSGCEECGKEHTDWVALRLCLSCGHVGCCDSSKGMHATKHFVNTTHPLIIALPDKAWKWCYVDKIYG